jgi:hypothetical protein
MTYPSSFADASAADALAFLKSPTLLARRFAEIVADRGGFLAHRILTGRWKMEGGALVYTPDEAVEASESPEKIKPGGEYPLIELSQDATLVIEALKKGFGTPITDEKVGRERMDPIDRAISMLVNKLISEFDEVAMAAIATAVTQALAATGAWTGEPKRIVKDVALAKAKLTGLRLGFRGDAVVMTDVQWATVASEILDLLPREQRNGVASGDFVEALGLTWMHSPDLPGGWLPTVVDTNNLGGIGHEDIPSPEYRKVEVARDLVAEVARFREKNDSTTVQVRKTDVPIVRNPKAAVEITGTGL